MIALGRRRPRADEFVVVAVTDATSEGGLNSSEGSSDGQSSGLITRRSQVRCLLLGPNTYGESFCAVALYAPG